MTPIAAGHVGPTMAAAFLASLVECVEALTVVLAVGAVRGWRNALGGAGAGLAVLATAVAVLGPALTLVPLALLQLILGVLLLLFGLRWLKKAVLRAAGILPLRDEAAAFDHEVGALRQAGVGKSGYDPAGFLTAFQITLIEGTEVVFIVVAVSAGGPGLLLPAAIAALAALAVIGAVGLIAHRPLAKVPENGLKFIVGVLLSGFGAFWAGEGLGLVWPGGDASIAGLLAGFLAIALICVRLCAGAAARRSPA